MNSNNSNNSSNSNSPNFLNSMMSLINTNRTTVNIVNIDDYEFLPALSYRLVYTPRAYYDLSFLENTNNTYEQKKVIADEDLIKLKYMTFKKDNEINNNSECPIMFYEFSENEEIIKLPCQHNYNKEAILKWLKEEAHTCPICRYEFKYKEINENTNINIYNNDYSDDRIETINDETINYETINDETINDETINDETNIFNIYETISTIYNLFNNNLTNNNLFNNNLINNNELMMQETLLNSYNSYNSSHRN